MRKRNHRRAVGAANPARDEHGRRSEHPIAADVAKVIET